MAYNPVGGFELKGMLGSGVNNSGLSALLGQSTATNQLNEQQRQFDVRAGFYKDWLAQSQQGQGGINGLLDAYNQAYNTAKSQNEAKYNSQLGLVDQVSGQQRADTIAATQRQQSDAMQNLSRLGMSNTTVAPSVTAGIQRQGQGALNNLADQLTREKLGVMQGFEYKGADPQITSTAISALSQNLNRPFSF